MKNVDGTAFQFPPGVADQILEQLGTPLFIKDHEGRYLYMNHAFCQFSGYKSEQLIGKQDSDILSELEANAIEQFENNVIAGNDVTAGNTAGKAAGDIVQLTMTDAHGLSHIIETSRTILNSGRPGEMSLIGIIHDVTPYKTTVNDLEQLVEERSMSLREAQSKLLQKERLMVVGQLAGSLAHQIRNPLGAIANAIALLRRHIPAGSSDFAREALDIAQEEVWSANRTITDLLDFARMAPPRKGPHSLVELVRSALLTENVPDPIEVNLELESITVWVDPKQCRDAMSKIIRNAVEVMPAGGKLRFHSEAINENLIRLCVEDTGHGLTERELDLLFEPLITSKALGFGLGLPSARALIENQGGHLFARSKEGCGATFVFELPLTYDPFDDAPDEECPPSAFG